MFIFYRKRFNDIVIIVENERTHLGEFRHMTQYQTATKTQADMVLADES